MRGGGLGNVLKAFIPKASPFCDHQVRGLGACVNREGVACGSPLHPRPPSPSPPACGPHTSIPRADAIRSHDSTKWALAAAALWLPRHLPACPGPTAGAGRRSPSGCQVPSAPRGVQGRARWCTQVKHSQDRANPAPPRLPVSTRNRRLPPPSPHCPGGRGTWGLECLLLQVTGRKRLPIMPLTMPR